MKKILKITGIVVAVLIVLGFAGKYIFFDRSPIPDETNITLTIQDIRDLAATSTGPLPVRLNMSLIAEGKFKAYTVMAENSKEYNCPFIAYQVVYNRPVMGKGKTIIIDTAMDKNKFESSIDPKTAFYDARYDKMQEAMKNSSAIIATHEHYDHTDGIATSPYLDQIIGKTYFTPEQLGSPLIMDGGFTKEILEKSQKLDYKGMHLFAPGIVLIKTPGHTEGHQMVYVKVKSGKEFLIIGDIAWHSDNITGLKNRGLLVSLYLGEDRDLVANQIRWLHDKIYKGKEGIIPIVSHDLEQHQAHVKAGFIGDGFEL